MGMNTRCKQHESLLHGARPVPLGEDWLLNRKDPMFTKGKFIYILITGVTHANIHKKPT